MSYVFLCLDSLYAFSVTRHKYVKSITLQVRKGYNRKHIMKGAISRCIEVLWCQGHLVLLLKNLCLS